MPDHYKSSAETHFPRDSSSLEAGAALTSALLHLLDKCLERDCLERVLAGWDDGSLGKSCHRGTRSWIDEVEMVQGATEAAALTGRLQCMIKWRGGDEDGDVGEEDRWMEEILSHGNPGTDTRPFCAGSGSSGVPPGAAMICRGMDAQTRAYGHQRVLGEAGAREGVYVLGAWVCGGGCARCVSAIKLRCFYCMCMERLRLYCLVGACSH